MAQTMQSIEDTIAFIRANRERIQLGIDNKEDVPMRLGRLYHMYITSRNDPGAMGLLMGVVDEYNKIYGRLM